MFITSFFSLFYVCGGLDHLNYAALRTSIHRIKLTQVHSERAFFSLEDGWSNTYERVYSYDVSIKYRFEYSSYIMKRYAIELPSHWYIVRVWSSEKLYG